jgi:hypothetical protein
MLKQQQWQVTNYAGLVYAAFIYLFDSERLSRPELSVSAGLVVAAWCANLAVLADLQRSMDDKFRTRIRRIYDSPYFTSEQRKQYSLEREEKSETILRALVLFTSLGAVLTLHVLSRTIGPS